MIAIMHQIMEEVNDAERKKINVWKTDCAKMITTYIEKIFDKKYTSCHFQIISVITSVRFIKT